MCEFWAKGHGFTTEFSAFESVSIGHTLGRRILASESFTSGDSERWQLYPGVLKGRAIGPSAPASTAWCSIATSISPGWTVSRA